MNNTELETEGTMAVYRKKIIDRINQVQDLGVLRYLDRFLELFLKEWGEMSYERILYEIYFVYAGKN